MPGDRLAYAIRDRRSGRRTDPEGAESHQLLGPRNRRERATTPRTEIARMVGGDALAPHARPTWHALEVRHRSSTASRAAQPRLGAGGLAVQLAQTTEARRLRAQNARPVEREAIPVIARFSLDDPDLRSPSRLACPAWGVALASHRLDLPRALRADQTSGRDKRPGAGGRVRASPRA